MLVKVSAPFETWRDLVLRATLVTKRQTANGQPLHGKYLKLLQTHQTPTNI